MRHIRESRTHNDWNGTHRHDGQADVQILARPINAARQRADQTNRRSAENADIPLVRQCINLGLEPATPNAARERNRAQITLFRIRKPHNLADNREYTPSGIRIPPRPHILDTHSHAKKMGQDTVHLEADSARTAKAAPYRRIGRNRNLDPDLAPWITQTEAGHNRAVTNVCVARPLITVPDVSLTWRTICPAVLVVSFRTGTSSSLPTVF